ncbi:pectinesterase [Morus notabilis]|nr:pectinesterase [Morus notabilis]
MDYNYDVILATICAYFLLFSMYVVHGTKSTISTCNQTPYPQVCHHFLNTNHLSTLDDKTTVSFHDLALKATMKQAVEAHRLVSTMDSDSFGERGKSAWQDCLELYKDTVDLLNRSVNSNNKNPLDTHTWLSASLANQHTCRNGFTDFQIPSHYDSFPSMLSNFSKLLSNSLAINKATIPSTATSFSKQVRSRRLLSDGFPEWVSAADRKLLQSGGAAAKADIVVAQDGSGGFKTISEAVEAAKNLGGGSKRIVVYVKAGVYKENVEIKNDIKNLMFVGDGIDATIVTGNRNNVDGSTTFQSATFGVSGDGFIAQDMTFENTAGPAKHQAVALRSGSDHSVFHRCSFKGYQDTLYVYSQRQFYRDCNVYGTVDFICGDAVAILQNCNILVRKPMSDQRNTVTSQARTDPNENTGIIIHNSRITASSDLRPVQGSFETYLGRPWQKYSRTVIMKSSLDGLIDPKGWLPWSGNFALSTLYYAEFMNSGAGAATGGRVSWPGYHVLTSAAEAGKFTVGNFLGGDSWIPATGVPFAAGL